MSSPLKTILIVGSCVVFIPLAVWGIVELVKHYEKTNQTKSETFDIQNIKPSQLKSKTRDVKAPNKLLQI